MAVRQPRPVGGFTLVELMVVVALVSILMGFAIPTFRAVSLNSSLSSVSSDFLASLLQARAEALRSGRNAIVIPNTGTDWSTGWYVFVDNNNNGSFDAGEPVVGRRDAALPVGITLAPAASIGNSVIFASTGFLRASGSVSAFAICFQAAETSRQRNVIVSRIGRAYINNPGGTTTTCTATAGPN